MSFDHWRERLRRWVCLHLGHNWRQDHAEPVVPLFLVCRRCGKWDRLRDLDDVSRAAGQRGRPEDR